MSDSSDRKRARPTLGPELGRKQPGVSGSSATRGAMRAPGQTCGSCVPILYSLHGLTMWLTLKHPQNKTAEAEAGCVHSNPRTPSPEWGGGGGEDASPNLDWNRRALNV